MPLAQTFWLCDTEYLSTSSSSRSLVRWRPGLFRNWSRAGNRHFNASWHRVQLPCHLSDLQTADIPTLALLRLVSADFLETCTRPEMRTKIKLLLWNYSAHALGLENNVRGDCAADFNEGASSNWVEARASRRRSQVQIPTSYHLESLLLRDVPSLLQANCLQELILRSRHDSRKQLCLFNICKWLKCPDLPCPKQSLSTSLRLFAFRGWS